MDAYNTKFPDYRYVPIKELKPIPETVDVEAMPAHTSAKDPARRQRDLVSRQLTAILRHKAVTMGLPIRDDGFVPVTALLNLNNKLKKANLDMVKQIVAENDKKRLELTQDATTGEWLLRAVQGHTIPTLDEDKMMRRIDDPKEFAHTTIVHGTTNEAWGFIRKTGLNKMSRNHVHFAKGYPGDKEVISGMRHTCTVFVEIDLPLAMQNGIRFLESSNGVILSSGHNGVISPVFFKHVYQVDPKTGGRVRVFGNDDMAKIKAEFMYRYLFVTDFEANCLEDQLIDPQEIIEFPLVVVDTHTNQVLGDLTFHHYVKPDVHKVTPFCTELTGITQAMVEAKGFPLAEVLDKFKAWFALHNFDPEDCCFITCGLWDLKTCLKNEALFRKIELDPIFKRFINLKEAFSLRYNFKQSKFGMLEMLEELELDLKGRHHSGIDDAFNIAHIVTRMGQDGVLITRDLTRFVV